MIQLDDLRRRYAQLNDEYLLELAREADTFTSEAFMVIQEEISSRKLGQNPQEVIPDPVYDLMPQYIESTYSDLQPTVRSTGHQACLGGALLKAAKRVLLASKLATAIIYIYIALSLIFVYISSTYLAEYKTMRLALLSSALSFATYAFLAVRFVKSSGGPISTNGLAFICTSTTAAFALSILQAYSQVKHDELLYTTWIAAALSIPFQWSMLITRVCQIRSIKSAEIPNCNLRFLLLRSFRFDTPRANDSLSPLAASIFAFTARIRWLPLLGEMFLDLTYDFRYAWTYESLLRTGLEGSRRSSIAASLYNPQWTGISPVCGTFIRVGKQEDWRVVVKSSLMRTEWVILMPGESPGLIEEMKVLRSGDFPANRILLLIPEDTPERLRASFSAVLDDLGFDLSHTTLTNGELYSFDTYWGVHGVAQGLESYRDAISEIKAWSSFKDRPEEEWCEIDHCHVLPTAAGRCPHCGLVINFDRYNTISQFDRGPGFQHPGLLFPVWEPILLENRRLLPATDHSEGDPAACQAHGHGRR